MTTLASKTTIPKDVIWREVDGEAVILNLQTGKYYGLDKVGTRMWNLLSEHHQVELVYRTMLDEYEVSEAQLQHDLLGLIDKLVEHGLVQIDETQTQDSAHVQAG